MVKAYVRLAREEGERLKEGAIEQIRVQQYLITI